MAIMGFIIVVAGRVFSDSTGMRVRSQNMIASAEEGGRVTALLKEDISQMGTKSFGALNASTGDYSIEIAEKVYFNSPSDLSSYELGSNYDNLIFHRANYDEEGKCLAVMKINWYKEGNKLLRTCNVIEDSKCGNLVPGCDGTAIEIARDVEEFKLMPSKPGKEATTPDPQFPFPAANGSFRIIIQAGSAYPTGSGETVYKLQNFQKSEPSHFYFSENGSGCKDLEFKAEEIYSIEFRLPCTGNACSGSAGNDNPNSMVMFNPGYDHLSVGLRNTAIMNGDPIVIDGKPIPDFLFYPPQNTTANQIRYFEFSVPKTIRACIGITAAFYSAEAYKGFLEIARFKVDRVEKAYHFPSAYNPSGTSKADVKAFELHLKIKKGKETNEVITVIPVPNNGLVPAGAS